MTNKSSWIFRLKLVLFVILVSVFISTVLSSLLFGGDTQVTQPTPPVTVDRTVSEEDYTRLYKSVRKSVVTIYSTDSSGKINSQGSGFVYNSNGYIVTNYHVIDSGSNLKIQYGNHKWSDAELVGQDRYTDLAVIKADTLPEDVAPLAVTNTLPLKGSRVVAVGAPYNLRGSITAGIVSGLNRSTSAFGQYTIPDMIQTDAALGKGNSGGPLINMNGEVLGVLRAKDGSVGYAVSNRMINTVVPSLISNGNHEHPYIGIKASIVGPQDASDSNLDPHEGLLVKEVVPSSPAVNKLNANYDDHQGVGGDVILSVDGHRIRDMESFTSYLMRKKQPGDTIELRILRKGETKTVEIELDSRGGL